MIRSAATLKLALEPRARCSPRQRRRRRRGARARRSSAGSRAGFRRRCLGPIEEVQVVDGDDLRGAPRRHQQRVHGVRDVDAAGKRLDRRPLQPVPGEVRGPAPGSAHRRLARPGTRPGASRSFQELENRVSEPPSPTEAAARAAAQLVRVFADACSLAKRGTIVDQDAHARSC